MAKVNFVTVNVRPDTKAQLDKFRKTDMGRLTYDDALKNLLKHWENTH